MYHHLGWRVAAVPMSSASAEVAGFSVASPWISSVTLTEDQTWSHDMCSCPQPKHANVL